MRQYEEVGFDCEVSGDWLWGYGVGRRVLGAIEDELAHRSLPALPRASFDPEQFPNLYMSGGYRGSKNARHANVAGVYSGEIGTIHF